MSACHAARPRGALSLVSEESSSSRWRHSCARLWSRVTGRRKSPGQAVRSRMAATGPSRCSVGPGKFPGRRDQLAPQDGHDRKPAVPTLDEAPDAGDRDIGKDRGNHVGGGRQCPRQHVRAAIRRRRRRPGHGHRIPTIPRCGWLPLRPRAASAPGTVGLAASAPGCRGAENGLRGLA